jgi:tRNA-(ms[2]io[6]A)-hydroxylase
MQLRIASSGLWLDTVLADFDAFLADHASCERKASATALSLASHYPDRPALVRAMIELAREELSHYAEVYAQMESRGLALQPERRDPYVRGLLRQIRGGPMAYFLDRLLVAGVIEARGCERFGMVASALPEGPLKAFYVDITRSEARHHGLFTHLAKAYFPADEVRARLDVLLLFEAELLAQIPVLAAVH